MDIAPFRLRPEEYASFFSQYASVSPLLVTDYDGTLAPFRKERLKAFPEPKTQSLLKSICDSNARLVVLSGRGSEEVFKLLSLPVEIWGCHGMERRSVSGEIIRIDVPKEAVEKLERFSLLFDVFPKSSVERKPSGIALHWRDNESNLEMYKKISGEIISSAKENALRVISFDGGIEFMLSFFSKGTALQNICNDNKDSRPICYLGDDITDEDAFKTIKNIAGGVGILVFERERESAADISIHNSEINKFLEFWLNNMAVKRTEY